MTRMPFDQPVSSPMFYAAGRSRSAFRGSTNMSLRGKRVVVLGGTSGIGFATAAAASHDGAAVVLASSRQERVDRAVAALPKSADGHGLDLAREDGVRPVLQRLRAFRRLAF